MLKKMQHMGSGEEETAIFFERSIQAVHSAMNQFSHSLELQQKGCELLCYANIHHNVCLEGEKYVLPSEEPCSFAQPPGKHASMAIFQF